jgi:hypothetical protein
MCHYLNLETCKPEPCGVLPKLHLVTDQLNVQYDEHQNLTIFVQVNFDKNCFQLRGASNMKRYSAEKLDCSDWENLFEHDIDIENFHVKSVFIFQDKLMLFSRGKPRQVMEQCCSFLLVVPLVLKNGTVVDIDAANYTYLKLDPVVYIQYLSRPTVNRMGEHVVIRAPMEDNYSNAFPRQIFEMVVPYGDFSKDASLINTKY